MVTNTLRKASTDIFHYMVVFGSVFLVYTESAIVLFGQELEEFSSFGRSLNSVWRIGLGDFDWEPLRGMDRPTVAIWFWSFSWIINLMLLNMLLAIIIDHYTEVRGEIGPDTETVFSQAVEIM